MRFAIADPPYIGQARRHYGVTAREVNHPLLIRHLCDDFPDGWALCLSSTTLRDILPLCPPDVRVMAWVKPFASFKSGVNPAYAWEPVIVRGGRTGKQRPKGEPTVRDWVSACITMRRGVHGAKPDAFCHWLFNVLGAERGDELCDVFPGSGAISRAWEAFRAQGRLGFMGRTISHSPGVISHSFEGLK